MLNKFRLFFRDNNTKLVRSDRIGLRSWIWVIFIIWTSSIIVSFFWNDQQVRSLIMEQARSELRASFFKDLTFRQWGTKHGGVYVPVTDETQPDPYIDNFPERDVITPSGRVLTLINPALMVREFNEMSMQYKQSQGHISSLRPINPVNRPDLWEENAIKALEKGTKEVSAISFIENKPYLRLIRPMVMGVKCLICHRDQGYKEGDISGGVSVSVPLAELNLIADRKVMQIGIGHVVLWFLGLVGIHFGSDKLRQRIEESNQAYNALREHEERTRAILGTSLDAIVIIDAMDIVTSWNMQAENIFGWSADDAIGSKLANLIIPQELQDRHKEGVKKYLEAGEAPFLNRRIEVNALHKNRYEFPVELTIAPITVDGQPAFSAFIRDITKQKKTAQKISDDYHSQRVIASVLEISMRSIPFKERLEQSLDQILSTPWLTLQGTGMIFVVDNETENLVLAAQRGVSEIIQKKCKQVKFGECLCGEAALKKIEVYSSCLDHRHTVVYEGMPSHGHYCIPINSENGLMGVLNLYLDHGHERNNEEIDFLNVIANTLGNMISHQQHEEKLKHYAYYDELTELPNRTLLVDRMEQCIKHSKRNANYKYAVLYLDLDRFKNINDSLGHAVGDQVLDCVAERLLKYLRQGDTVARVGGDEFGMLLDDIEGVSDAYRTANRIHKELLKPLQLERYEVFTSTSIGIVMGLKSYDTPSDLLRDADIAMYRAKQQGSGHTVIFDEEMHDNAVKLLNIETELRRAVERNEFCIHYQPIISTETNCIVGFESLVRWNHPERGMVFPDEFISIIEETGLINEVGLWVLQESCRQVSIWNNQLPKYRSLYVSVNLSAIQFLQKDLISKIDHCLHSISFNTDNLRLEVTESVLMKNPETAIQMLNDLKSRNIRLYLDDFGTGFSSLSYLHNFPFDTLKIDRSFIAKLDRGEEHIGMVKTIVAVAKNFNMDVIAEGVETTEQLLQLDKLGCKTIQGYCYSKPLPAESVEKILATSDWVVERNNIIHSSK